MEPSTPTQLPPPTPTPTPVPTPIPPAAPKRVRSVRGFDVLILTVAALAAGGAWLALARSNQSYQLLKGGVASLAATGPSAANAPTAPAVDPNRRVDIKVDASDPTQGAANAPVTLVEFSDFQCPFCRRFAPILNKVLTDYAGKVRLVYRDFPLEQLHANAKPAAIAAQCVADLAGSDAFFKFHDGLFADQEALGQPLYEKLARKIDSLNFDKFKQCVAKKDSLAEVEDDFKAGVAAGVNGTPTTFVNGKAVEGSDETSLRAAIDEALKK